jgi:hypothetical protein
MKTMTCKQLGGACDKQFSADSFEQIGEQSKKHAMEMMQTGDKEHLIAMEEMRKLMSSSEAMRDWLETKRKEFEGLPENK